MADSATPAADAAATTPAAMFFAFTRGKSTDPQAMKDFGIDQTTKVADAIGRLTRPVYTLEVLTDPAEVSVAGLRARLASFRDTLRPADTFVMYSHTHGGSRGLLIDIENPDRNLVAYQWAALAEDIVSLPARTVVVFTMSCHSGHLADAVKSLAASWQGQRASAGRNLIVITSVSSDQISGATDHSTEPDGIGHPFTYAVRTALGGAADGAGGSARDGQITYEELVRYVLETTRQQSRDQLAEPQLAGEYDRDAIFAATPTPS